MHILIKLATQHVAVVRDLHASRVIPARLGAFVSATICVVCSVDAANSDSAAALLCSYCA